MRSEYSTYEAKAQFSEIIRQVRQGKTIMVSYRGEPVAEIRPFQRRGLLARPREPLGNDRMSIASNERGGTSLAREYERRGVLLARPAKRVKDPNPAQGRSATRGGSVARQRAFSPSEIT